MRSSFTKLMLVAVVGAVCSVSYAGTAQFVVTDDDNPGANTATVYTVSGSTLTQKTVISTGGQGLGYGFFATNRASVAHSRRHGNCVYVADSGSNDIAGINLNTLTVTGNFKGSPSDSGAGFGIGLTAKVDYLYANFPGSTTIATFTENPGCILRFLGDVGPVIGKNFGALEGLQAHFGILVGAFHDGSIQSWDVSHGMPVSNNDLQLSTGYRKNGSEPAAVDVTADARWAVFGDSTASSTEVEVSAITATGLSPTVDYCCGTLGSGLDSNNVRLSPDQSLIYITNNISGQLTAALFDPSTGVISGFCSSEVFKNFGPSYVLAAANVAKNTSGNGGQVYVAETGAGLGPSAVAIVDITSGGGSCTLIEDSLSPVNDANAKDFLFSLAAAPPRKF